MTFRKRPPDQPVFPFAEATPPKTDGPPCLKCGGPTAVTPGVGPHASRADCPACGAWRWLPKNRP